MRLLKIGRDASCDIVLYSEKVSSVHAEITLLNNGDITIEDKGSRNGTFIMNMPIKPGKSVKIRRGDAIRFGDVELQWSQVPMPEDNSAYKGVYGIGSHFNNDIQISGATVSRYHATVKHGKDGKFYLLDHSKNGTTVDGVKVSANTPVRIKKNSSVVCGGVPVNLSRLPWPKNAWKKVASIAAAIAALVGICLGWGHKIWPDSPYTAEEIYKKYNSSVVMLVGYYHYEVTAGDLPIGVLRDLGVETKFGESMYFGTGFFISEDGKILTNLHLTKPWLFDKNLKKWEDDIRKDFARKAELRSAILPLYGLMPQGLSAYTAQIKVVGVLDGIGIVPQGKKFSEDNLSLCSVVSEEEDVNKDVALIQCDNQELPNKATFIDICEMIDVSKDALSVGKPMFTMGFILPELTQEHLDKIGGLRLLMHTGHISQINDKFSFRFDAVSAPGSSGSPIFDEYGKVIGILSGGIDGIEINYGIQAIHIKELLEKYEVISKK